MLVALRGATRDEGVAAGFVGAVVEVGVTAGSGAVSVEEMVWMPRPWVEEVSVGGGGMLTWRVGCFVCGPGVPSLDLMAGVDALLLGLDGAVGSIGGGDWTSWSFGTGDDECVAGADSASALIGDSSDREVGEVNPFRPGDPEGRSSPLESMSI
jgi:hypothetical protein